MRNDLNNRDPAGRSLMRTRLLAVTSVVFSALEIQPERECVVGACFDINAPADNILGVPGGGSGQAVSDGIYLMLHPLSVGEHTVRFGGTFDAFDFTLDITYHITVAK